MSLVLDGSIALAWTFLDETTAATRDAFEAVAEGGAWVPALWRLEVANALLMGVRRGRIDLAFRAAALADLAVLDISVDGETDGHAWGATLQLADRFRLTLYDAAYVELALRRALPLATLDRAMADAARALGVTVLGDAG